MNVHKVKILGCAVTIISTLAVTGACYAGEAPSVLPLERYTSLSDSALRDVLPRLFYEGFKQVKSYTVSVVQTGTFPAAKRSGQSLQINSVAIAAMDAVIEADYLSSSIGDGGEALRRYLAQLNESAAKFSGGDWQLWLRTLPRFQEFYRAQVSAGPIEINVPYDLLRQTILTSAIGSVIVRELAEIDLEPERSSLGSNYADALNRRSASLVARAGFDAAPGTALVIYSALKNIQENRGQRLETIECNEARFQRMLQASGIRVLSRESGGTLVSFSAGQRLFDRLSGCN